jgi:hypothetical protein
MHFLLDVKVYFYKILNIMKKSVKKLLPIVAGINGLLCTNLLGEGADPTPKMQVAFSSEEQVAVKEMSESLASFSKPIGEKAGDALLNTNVRGDAQKPEEFQSDVKIELAQVKNSKENMGLKSDWFQIKVTLKAVTENKNTKWTEPCTVQLWVGYNLPGGGMLLLQSSFTCATLPVNIEQTFYFFIPGDIALKHGLPNTPDFIAVCFIHDGIAQEAVIVGKDGKDTHRSNGNAFLLEIKKNSTIEPRYMRNADQLPPYGTKRIKDHPTSLVEIDT